MTREESCLKNYRMIDLSDQKGYLCGKIFADLGAKVIKIEPPGGDPGRKIAPFYKDSTDPNKSLFWFAFNTGKKSVTLNIENAEGKKILKSLVETADFLVESFEPGYLDKLGIGYADLSQVNQRLIMGSISPFGQDGPHASWKGPDIVPWAMSCYMWLTGEPGRAPLRISQSPQAYLHASAITAAGLLLALRYRETTGEGQHVDTAAQQCPIWMLTHTYAYWDLLEINIRRAGVFRHYGQVLLRTVWECKDGYITFFFSGGHIGAKGQRRVAEMIDRDGMADDWLRELNWEEWDAFTANQEEVDAVTEVFSRFFKSKTKTELLEEAVKSNIMLAPIQNITDIMENRQLKARDYWAEVHHPELNAAITYPGAPCKLSETPWHIRSRAPLIGEHNSEIYEGELDISKVKLNNLKEAGVI